jgi:hypothetical protein
VHRGLLAGLHDADDVGDETLVQEVIEGARLDVVVLERFGIQRGVLSIGVRAGTRAGQPPMPGTKKNRPSGRLGADAGRSG